MKRFFISLLCTISFLTPVKAQNFLTGFEDIPLMSGFKQIEGDNFSFGNEETRLIEAQITTSQKKSFSDVKDFYIKALAQLGWTLVKNSDSSLELFRENDVLVISKTAKSPLKISISLKNRD